MAGICLKIKTNNSLYVIIIIIIIIVVVTVIITVIIIIIIIIITKVIMHSQVNRVLKDNTHPSHSLFTLLPCGKRYSRI